MITKMPRQAFVEAHKQVNSEINDLIYYSVSSVSTVWISLSVFDLKRFKTFRNTAHVAGLAAVFCLS